LGAGAIIKLSGEGEIHGLTTSASIWMTAAIGVSAGMGREATAVVSTLIALFVLAVLRRVERRSEARGKAEGYGCLTFRAAGCSDCARASSAGYPGCPAAALSPG